MTNYIEIPKTNYKVTRMQKNEHIYNSFWVELKIIGSS